jgi:aminoglycoside phosphotransferase (APT) family kinase protein
MTQPASVPDSDPAADPGSDFRPHREDRDPEATRRGLARWLAGVARDGAPPSGVAPEVTLTGGDPAGNGVSSVTVPVRVHWPEGPADYVLRTEPSAADIPVFRTYDLRSQFEAMRLVGELTSVPVPKVRWLEPSGTVLGTPFLVMDAVSGQVPPDMVPYNLGDSWLFDAAPADQRKLQEGSVAVLARLHQIPDASEKFAFLLPDFPGETPLRRRLAWLRDWYQFAADDLAPVPLVDKSLTWLEANCPAPHEEPVLCWGDARIGNILYRDFTPVGVLDWEMAALGPRQLDLSWMISAHRVFEYLAGTLELPGMPEFHREQDIVASYERLAGCRVGDLAWYHLYALVQWAVVFLRTGTSQLRFKERDMPAEIEELIYHRGLLEEEAAAAGALS